MAFRPPVSSTPTITGPSGFVVPPSAQAGDDAGTNAISGSLEVLPGKTAKPSTLGTSNGVFSYGIEPDNSNTTGGLISAFDVLPFYAADQDPSCINSSSGCPQDNFIGGPPAFPNFRNGDYPSTFNGYSEGFTTFYATPVTGTYTLQVVIQTSNAGNYSSPTVSGTLTSTNPLGAWAVPPTVTPDGSNGATVNFTPPSGVSETVVNVDDLSTGGVFTAVATAGATSVAIPGNIGPGNPVTPTFNSGDTLLVQLIGADYPLFEAAPPINKQLTPALTGTNGQSDITTADFEGTYGAVATIRSHGSKALLHNLHR